MFRLESNQKIGNYLSELIRKNYPSKRQFCKEYILASNGIINDDEIRKMANRISQITKGVKAVQTYDLPIFTELLGVSCEQILSAGEYSVPQASRVTNYSIAFSKDPVEWEEFINRKDKLILNQDEYCKTILDYALEFGNYEFLKYLIDKKYIWFDSKKDNDYVINFGAGTSIQRRDIRFQDYGLQSKLFEEDQLRLQLIALAADHNDIYILDELRARENPQMYNAHYWTMLHPDFSESYNENTVRHISRSSNEVLDYFTDEFEIRDRIQHKNKQDHSHCYMYPHISELIDLMIENNSPFTETAIKKAIKHNHSTYKKLCELVIKLKNDEHYLKDYMQDMWIKHCQEDLKFSDNGNVVSFRGFYTALTTQSAPDGLITNVAHATKTSKNPILKNLIEELNESYDKVKNMADHLEELE